MDFTRKQEKLLDKQKWAKYNDKVCGYTHVVALCTKPQPQELWLTNSGGEK